VDKLHLCSPLVHNFQPKQEKRRRAKREIDNGRK
jgi:hypothetical protein